MITVELTKDKETKNTVRFQAANENPAVKTLYIEKSDPLSKADHITVTVTKGHGA